MNILLAQYSGFCFGVKRAISIAGRCANQNGKIYSLGPLIHNPREIARLSNKILPVSNLNQIDPTDHSAKPIVVIRTHGVGPQVFTQAKDLGLEVVDGTCPFVKKAQLEAKELQSKGYQVIIIGDKNHPEVEAIKEWTDQKAWVISSEADILSLPKAEKIGVLAQTTQQKAFFEEVVESLKKRCKQIVVKNTICDATTNRQQAILDLAEQVEMMIIIGGKNSANTQKLLQICQKQGVPAQLVEGALDLDLALFDGLNSVGVCAGASTPDWIIEEVVGKMVEMEKKDECVVDEVMNETVIENIAVNAEESKAVEVNKNTTIQEEVTSESVENDPIAPIEEESFADFYNREIKDFRRGSRIKGTVVQIRDNELLIDIGGKSEGLLPSNQLMDDEAENIREKFTIGDEIDVIVLKKENKEGYPILSKKLVDQVIVWEKLTAAKEEQIPVTGKVVEVVKGGLLVDVGIRGFVPASLVDIRFVDDLKSYIGKEVTAKILECDRGHNKLLLSPKAILLAEAQTKKEALWGEITQGQIREGVVSRLTNFGAFVDLGGVDGLLHVSEMAWYRINHPSDLLKEGDNVQVFVLSADMETKKISLGLKQLVANPWDLVTEKYPVGAIVNATVMRTANFGAFLQLEPGVEGLVHISHLSIKHVAKTEDVVKPGDVVEVKVLEINLENKRISLSIKETLPEEPKEATAFDKEAVTEQEDAVGAHEESLNATLADIFPDEMK